MITSIGKGDSAYITWKIDWKVVPWWRRLLAIVKIPFDIINLIVTGRAYFGYFKFRK